MKKAFIAFSCLFLCFISLAFQSNHHDFYSKSDLDKIDYVLDNFHQIRSVNTDSAIYYLNEIILLADQNELLDKKAEALLNIGVCNYYNGNVEQELAYHQKALSIAEDINNPRIQGAVYNEMAMYYNRQKESKKSVEALKQAFKYCTLANDLPCLATVIRNQGRDFLLEGKVDSAKSRFLASYELKKQLNDTVGIPYALNDLAEVAIQEKDYDLAVSYIQRSSELRKVLRDSF